jgi:long-subunit acyl-CoA synthetase (AMP-forming)
MSWDEFLKKGAQVQDVVIEQRMNDVRGETLATIIYTSGTSGMKFFKNIDHLGKVLRWV